MASASAPDYLERCGSLARGWEFVQPRCSLDLLMRLAQAALVLGAFLAAAAASGCGKKDPVRALIDDLVEAGEDRSAERIGERLADEFRGQNGMGRADAVATIRRYLAGYEKVDLEVYDVEVQRADGAADVSFRAEFSGRALSIGGLGGLLPPEALYRFDLRVVDAGGSWKVKSAAWEEVAPPSDGR
jgi:hypothetical protein